MNIDVRRVLPYYQIQIPSSTISSRQQPRIRATHIACDL